jgi:hypothetical protein
MSSGLNVPLADRNTCQVLKLPQEAWSHHVWIFFPCNLRSVDPNTDHTLLAVLCPLQSSTYYDANVTFRPQPLWLVSIRFDTLRHSPRLSPCLPLSSWFQVPSHLTSPRLAPAHLKLPTLSSHLYYTCIVVHPEVTALSLKLLHYLSIMSTCCTHFAVSC